MMKDLSSVLEYCDKSEEFAKSELANGAIVRAFVTRWADEPKLGGIAAHASVWSCSITFAPETTAQARTLVKLFGGKWTKHFSEFDGKVRFMRDDKLDDLKLVVEVGPSPSCKIVPVTETVTREVTRFVLEGDCDPLLAD